MQRRDKSIGVCEHRHHWYSVYTDQSYRAALRQQTRTKVFFRFERFINEIFVIDYVKLYTVYNMIHA